MNDRQSDLRPSPISLVIPCRPEYVALCRLVAGALGARDLLDEEEVADIKVIVTEACNCFLGMARVGSDAACSDAQVGRGEPPEGCSLRMDFDSRPEAFVISVLYPEKRELVSWLEGCDPMSEAGLGLTILKSLTDEMVEFEKEPEGTVLQLTRNWL